MGNLNLDTINQPPKLVVLDRDGVINVDSDDYIKSPDEWQPLPDSLEAIAQLNAHGFRVVVATNQSGIGREMFDARTLAAIHNKMHQMLSRCGGRIDAVFFCPHTERSGCDCRKPKPGLMHEIEQRFRISLDGVPCVGDSLRDLQAAVAVNAQPILVRSGKGEKTLQHNHNKLPPNTLAFADLADFVNVFLTDPSNQ
jgi:histidinol-phosphate phosphatase family domain/HAD-superfamily hydrolase, subfamily IIIA